MNADAAISPDLKPMLETAAEVVFKPELDPFINLIVKQQNGDATHFRMKRDAPMKKVNHHQMSASSHPPPSTAHGYVLFTPKPGLANREVSMGWAQPAP